MHKLLVIICLEMFMFNCSPIHKCNSNNSIEQIGQERQVYNFAEIPAELLNHVEKMGVDSSSLLNEYEGKYLNFIFKTDSLAFNLVGKKVGFNRNKIDFFKDERERLYHDFSAGGVGGAALYIFNATQKAESGDYDAAIVYWNKFQLPVEQVVGRLKNQR
jgi:hypothetical protein